MNYSNITTDVRERLYVLLYVTIDMIRCYFLYCLCNYVVVYYVNLYSV